MILRHVLRAIVWASTLSSCAFAAESVRPITDIVTNVHAFVEVKDGDTVLASKSYTQAAGEIFPSVPQPLINLRYVVPPPDPTLDFGFAAGVASSNSLVSSLVSTGGDNPSGLSNYTATAQWSGHIVNRYVAPETFTIITLIGDVNNGSMDFAVNGSSIYRTSAGGIGEWRYDILLGAGAGADISLTAMSRQCFSCGSTTAGLAYVTTTAPVPEASTSTMLAAGLGLAALMGRRRKSSVRYPA